VSLMTLRLHRDDSGLLEFDATVVERREHEGRPALILDRTAFFSESGGQPSDEGDIDGVPVAAVLDLPSGLLHVLESAVTGDQVHGRVDATRRRDHTQQHHGQHLLSRAFLDVAEAATTSFHLGTTSSTIDLDREVTDADTRAAEIRCNEVIWEALPVTIRTVDRDQASALGVRLPPRTDDGVRLVEVESYDSRACSGTHPRNTANVGLALVLGHRRHKGGSRVSFVCGHRALGAFREQHGTLQRLGDILSASLDGLPDAAERALARAQELERRSRVLLARALEGEARRLLAEASGAPALVTAVFEGWPPEELRSLAQITTGMAPSVTLLASRGDRAHLVFAQTPGLGHDIPALLRHAAGLLGGRGGGKGDLAQGGGEHLERLDEALAGAAATVRGASSTQA